MSSKRSCFIGARISFGALDVVFFDTTSLYFEGEGGAIGQLGHTKDHRPDLNQMIVGVVNR
jgi:transposase